ncbi:hypothetical protein [Cellulomonas uda]|uniref:hypothetical protein n=1 Tax=Cellulomonas uda TaxID=1714 RepID=UPI001145167D|nr:hypothetical protein [Cellulomonas uda]NII65870.1 hypothetical protein [Cellulomonas uda]
MPDESEFADRFRRTVDQELSAALKQAPHPEADERVLLLAPHRRGWGRPIAVAAVVASFLAVGAVVAASTMRDGPRGLRSASTPTMSTAPTVVAVSGPTEAVTGQVGVRMFAALGPVTLSSQSGCLADQDGRLLVLDPSWSWDPETETLTSVPTGERYHLGDAVEMAGGGGALDTGRVTWPIESVPLACADYSGPALFVWAPGAQTSSSSVPPEG